MSTSAAVEIRAGSKSTTSWAMGKLSVWSAANGSGEGVGLLFGLQATAARITAISQAGARIGGRLTGAARRCGEAGSVRFAAKRATGGRLMHPDCRKTDVSMKF